MKITGPVATHTERTAEISGGAPMRDNQKVGFHPTQITLSSINGRPTWVTVSGRRSTGKRAGRTTNTGYAISDSGDIEPNYRTGAPPKWVAAAVTYLCTENPPQSAVLLHDEAFDYPYPKTQTDNVYLAVDHALDNYERRQFKERLRIAGHGGMEPADWLDAACDADSHLDIIEPWWEQHGAAAVKAVLNGLNHDIPYSAAVRLVSVAVRACIVIHGAELAREEPGALTSGTVGLAARAAKHHGNTP